MATVTKFIMGIMTAVGLSGRPSAPPPRGAGAEPVAPRGVVMVVGGVGGTETLELASQWALPRAGVRHEIRVFTWQHGRGHVFKDLQDTDNIKRKADELALTLW